MFVPEVYTKTYNIKHFTILPDFPPAYQLRGLFGNSILTTSPYITDTAFPEAHVITYTNYINDAIALCKSLRADYFLIKTRSAAFSELLSRAFLLFDGFTTMLLDIKHNNDYLWNSIINGKTRNQTRKGYKSNPLVRWGSHDVLHDFYDVIAASQSELGTPVHSYNYFSNILKYHSNARLIVLYLSGKPVSAGLTVMKENVLYHPYAGTLNRAKPTSVNNVLYWEIIKAGIEHNCRLFDMGRSAKNSGNEKYKRSWGAAELPLFYHYFLHKKKQMPKFDTRIMKLLTALWRYVPPEVAKKSGPYFIRSIP